VGKAALAHRAAMNNNWKYFLDGALVILIIGFVMTGCVAGRAAAMVTGPTNQRTCYI
jgi:hypothetical protein